MANKSGDSSLHDWFNKSKSSDGKKGWVQLGGKYAGKPCAKQPGQKTKPKCGSSKMKRNLNKKEEAAAFRRKNKQDPNPNRKGKAKNVRTEETIDQLFRRTLEEKKAQKCWPGYEKKGTKKMFGKTYNNCVKKEEVEHVKEGRGPRGYTPSPERIQREQEANKKRREKLTPAQRSDEDKSNKKFVDSLLNTEGAKPDYIDIDGDGDTEESMKKAVKDKKKGKKKIEEGKKDACYHKVKSRYSVWPSAYASGALVKCRKVGAKNWGNKSKKESYSWRDELDFVQEGAAWTKKAGKNKKGGLNEKGRKSYEAENPGSDLKAPVTGKVKKGGKAAKRRKSFCARMGGMKGPMKDEKGRPTRKALALRKWKCRKS